MRALLLAAWLVSPAAATEPPRDSLGFVLPPVVAPATSTAPALSSAAAVAPERSRTEPAQTRTTPQAPERDWRSPQSKEKGAKPLRVKRDIFEDSEKDPNDPCPDGTWWYRIYDACRLIECRRGPNKTFMKLRCPVKHHLHTYRHEGTVHPFECVRDFDPKNPRGDGRKGVCNPCQRPDHSRVPLPKGTY